mmetsp:Transcript_16995/g.23370  ORF Transcript_16995/g.23370 Transcript_16995/m.23370 type:complete len:85 (+) Transcript_16995:311-565(+)
MLLLFFVHSVEAPAIFQKWSWYFQDTAEMSWTAACVNMILTALLRHHQAKKKLLEYLLSGLPGCLFQKKIINKHNDSKSTIYNT